jgi:tRNA (guanine-N7-)-methyltransferase
VSAPLLLATPSGDRTLRDLPLPLDLDALLPGGESWEVEIGFGKGRYLLRRALAEPQRRFLGIEVAGKYFALLVGRARRRGAGNLLALRGEAQAALSAVLPRRFATAVHVYFPDPWPKTRHERRRLFDAETVDLVFGLLEPGGTLFFATDHLEYGEAVAALLRAHPRATVRRRDGGWAEGPRTNYEAKYLAEGRPILRLEVAWAGGEGEAALHPEGRAGVLAAYRAAAGDVAAAPEAATP